MRLEMLEHFFIHFQYLHYNSFTKKALFFLVGLLRGVKCLYFSNLKKKLIKEDIFHKNLYLNIKPRTAAFQKMSKLTEK